MIANACLRSGRTSFRPEAVVVAAALLLAACGRGGEERGPVLEGLPQGTVTIEADDGPVTFRVAIADTTAARQRGLMRVPSLPAGTGMAFLFEEPSSGGFWMKDTLIPLTIAFWDEEGRIVRILDMEPCRADPCPVYDPEAVYIGALEVNRGALREGGVEVGDTIRLRTDPA